MAEFLIEKFITRKITPEEVLSILDETERAGLVHFGSNCADKAEFMCNCCSCCCMFLWGLLELGHPHAVATSSYVASVNKALCNGYGICSDGRCQVGAMKQVDGTMQVQADKCLGCGLCASICPTEAIELKQRDIPPETPSTIKDMALKILTDKGKADTFMEIIMR
jgi:electron transport complex protein RnfB